MMEEHLVYLFTLKLCSTEILTSTPKDTLTDAHTLMRINDFILFHANFWQLFPYRKIIYHLGCKSC